jgi:hypothetical protein
MTFDEALRLHGGAVREDVAHACRYLESQGFRYGRDFLTGNAVQMAGEAIIELEHEFDMEVAERGFPAGWPKDGGGYCD